MRDSEVELKFAILPSAIGDLEAHPLIAGAAETVESELASTYFDTHDGAFRKARVACRIRVSDGARILTVKTPTQDATSRGEWESETDDDAPDLALLPKARLPRGLRKAKDLAPVFRVEVDRRTWMIAQGASLIEAALDRGWISAAEAQAPVCEFELELKHGEARDLFALGRRLCEDLPLQLDLRSKAQRGWLLKDGAPLLADKAEAPRLDPDGSFADGFRALAQACLEPLAANAPILRATHAPEALHQTRTALRRLRALLRVYARHLGDDAFEHVRGELKWLSHLLGAVRDLDVAAARFAKHAKTADLTSLVGARRDAAHARVVAALDSARYRLMLLDMAEWLALGAWTRRKPAKASRGSIADIVALEFNRWDDRIRKGAAALDELDAGERHKVRIRAKSFAYACELTENLVARRDRKAHAAYVKALKGLQTALGSLNDARVARDLIEDLRPDAPREALRHASRRMTRQADKLEAATAKAQRRFAQAPRPWRD